jgi:acyl-CoA synthetase (AMP-forming)/AMP-acid ligase II
MFLAVIRARGVAAPLNPAYTQEEFEFYLSDSEARLLVTNAEGNAAAQAATVKLGLAHAAASLHDAAGPVHSPASRSRLWRTGLMAAARRALSPPTTRRTWPCSCTPPARRAGPRACR